MIKKIFESCLSITNIFIYIFFFKIFKFLKKRKLIVVFLTETESGIKQHLELIHYLFKGKKEYKVIRIFDFIYKKKFFNFINSRLIKYLVGCDAIISVNRNRTFNINIKSIYIAGDIYDTFHYLEPTKNIGLMEKSDYKLHNFDLILVSSKLSKSFYQKKIAFLKSDSQKNKKKTKLIEIGYPKLDRAIEYLKLNKVTLPKCILILTTSFGELNFKVYDLVNNIRKKHDNPIIIRFHPMFIRHNNKIFKKVCLKLQKLKNVEIDLETNYFDSFLRSKFLITEATSSLYVFAFSTLRPIITCLNEKKLNKYQKSTSFYKDISKIGLNLNNINSEINEKIYMLEKKKIILKNNIKKLRNKHFNKLLLNSKNNFIKNLNHIIAR